MHSEMLNLSLSLATTAALPKFQSQSLKLLIIIVTLSSSILNLGSNVMSIGKFIPDSR